MPACDRRGPVVSVGTPSPGAAVLDLRARDRGPAATLTFGDRSLRAAPGTYCWEQGGVGECADAFGPVVRDHALSIEGGVLLQVTGDASSVEAAVGVLVERPGSDRFRRIQELDVSDGEARIRVLPGDYVLDVFGVWNEGDGAFDFPLRVG